MAAPHNDLYPDEIAQLAIRRRELNERHTLGLGQQNYLEGVARNEYGRNLGDLTTRFDRIREKLPWGFAARGMLNSGAYKGYLTPGTQNVQGGALQRYAIDRNRALGDLGSRFQDTMGGYNLAKQQLEMIRSSGQQNINELETARRQTIAAMLREAGY